MQDAAESVGMLENEWSRLAAEWGSLSAGWRDKAARTFDQTYWADTKALVAALLPDIRGGIEDLERLGREAEANMD